MNMIDIGMSGILAANRSLHATSGNVANIATPGYSRRGVLLSGNAHGGVDASAAMRINEGYRTQQMWQAANASGRAQAAQSHLDQLEGMVGGNPASGDIQHRDLGLGAFFGALRGATGEPGDPVLRNAVLDTASGMTRQFNGMRAAFEDQLRSIERQRDVTVEQVNGLATQIADLNGRIAVGLASGGDVAALMDRRDVAVDQMAGLAGVRVVQQRDGTVDVSMAFGQPLVVGKQAGRIDIRRDGHGRQALVISFGQQKMPLRSTHVGGALRGLAEVENDVLRPQLDALRTLAVETAKRVNAQLAQGYDMHGNPGKPLLAFDEASGRLGVVPDMQPEALAFSADPDHPGDNRNLLALSDLGSTRIEMPGHGTVSIENAFASIVGKVGSASQQNKLVAETAQAVRTQAENDWLSLSGVDNDEEAMNLVRFKDMYNANLKVIAVANALFETTLNAI